MSDEEKMKIKLLIDKSKRRVLFAEAGKECVDFFFNILSLPLSKVVSYVTKESMVGSLGTLYGSLEKLCIDDYLQNDDLINDDVVDPYSSLLLGIEFPDVDDPNDPDYDPELENDVESDDLDYDSDDLKDPDSESEESVVTNCQSCQRSVNEAKSPISSSDDDDDDDNGGGYVKGTGVSSYIIMDDLSVEPMSKISSIVLLKKFKVQDVSQLVEFTTSVDSKMISPLLKASLMSKTVLTDIFLPKKPAANISWRDEDN